MIKEEEVYRIGKLGKPHGVKGEINFQLDDDVFDRVDAEYLVLKLDGIMVPFFMEEYRFRSDEVALVKFCDVDTQERAAELTGTEVFFPRELAEADEDANLSWAQIRGYEIVTPEGKNVGRIDNVDDSTENILFELEDGTLIPVAEEWIIDMNNKERKIVMRLPEGLLEL